MEAKKREVVRKNEEGLRSITNIILVGVLLAAGAVLYAGLTLWAYHRSAVLYEKVDL